MTVKELINELKKYSKKNEVIVFVDSGKGYLSDVEIDKIVGNCDRVEIICGEIETFQ